MMKMNTGKKKKILPYILEWKPMQQYGEEKKAETHHQNIIKLMELVLASSA